MPFVQRIFTVFNILRRPYFYYYILFILLYFFERTFSYETDLRHPKAL